MAAAALDYMVGVLTAHTEAVAVAVVEIVPVRPLTIVVVENMGAVVARPIFPAPLAVVVAVLAGKIV